MLLLGVLQAQAAGAVGAGSFDLLEQRVLTTTETSVTFSSLSTYAADYQHLQIRWTARTSRTSSGAQQIIVNFNGDTANNYIYHRLFGNGSTVTSDSSGAIGFISAGVANTNASSSGIYGFGVLDILDAFSSSKNTTTRLLAGYQTGIHLQSGLWTNTNALSSITLKPEGADNIVTGSRFSLYGVKGSA